MGKIVSKERLELVDQVESGLGIPDTEHQCWKDAEVYSIAGMFHVEFPDSFYHFGGYLLVLPDGKSRGMMTDMYGDAVIFGEFSNGKRSLKISKVYCVYLSNCTNPNVLTYELESEGGTKFNGKWYENPEYPDAGSDVICSVFPTQISTQAFVSMIDAREDQGFERMALDLHREEYIALSGDSEERE